MKNLWTLAVVLLLAPITALAQNSTAAQAAANYIEGGTWSYPTFIQVVATKTTVQGDVVIDCALAPSGHVTSCLVTPSTPTATPDKDKLIGLAYLQFASVDPASIDGGVQPGDRVRFHYSTKDPQHSDVADAAKLTFSAEDADLISRYEGATWAFPNGRDMFLAYPDAAKAQSVSGESVIDCTIALSGALSACNLTSEKPAGYGFGEATVKLFVAHCHVDPATVAGGIHDGDRHKFTMKWSLP